MTGLISSMNTCAVSDCKKRKQGAQVGMAFSRHAVNTSMYAHRQPSLAGSAANVVAETSVREGRKAWQRSLEDAAKEFKHGYALVLLVEYTREPDLDVENETWLVGTQAQRAAVRAAEAAAVMVPPLGAMVPLQYGKEADRIMEGASGDDWISGAQSMRAYLRAQLIGGIVGNGLINPVKKWWWDLDSDEQGNIIPA